MKKTVKKSPRPAHLIYRDDVVAYAHSDNYDPLIVIGTPGGRESFSLNDAKRLLSWLVKACAYAEWVDAENRRLEKEENE